MGPRGFHQSFAKALKWAISDSDTDERLESGLADVSVGIRILLLCACLLRVIWT